MSAFLDLARVAHTCERREFMIYTTYTKSLTKFVQKDNNILS